ncbi:MAG: sensor histidine kinase [Polyangiaceae bacterium]
MAEKARIQEFQERFIAVLGHDLRNPLSSIDMGASLLRQRAEQNQDETAARVLDRMKASSRRMTRMIGQILDLTRSRLAGGLEMEPAPVDLCRTITTIVDELRTANPTRAIEFHCPKSTVGNWDHDRLAQVFSNLVGNAVSYGPKDRPVQIDMQEENEEVVTVSVHNEGPPIPQALRTELFSPFRRGARDSKSAETAGLGLGLYISREIVLAHGGEIDVRSTATDGTTFRVTLPRNAPTQSTKVYV